MTVAGLPDAVIALPAPYTRDAWLAARRQGIGGSDASVIAGVNPYRSALELWLDKTGQVPADDDTYGPDDVRWWGHALEDDIAEAFCQQTRLRTLQPEAMFCHAERPWQIATVDRLVYDVATGSAPVGVLEIKTTGLWQAGEWQDGEVPAAALVQLQHYLAVTGLRRGWLAGLIAGQQFVVREIPRDDELIAMLCQRERDFWQRVQDNTPPPPDGSAGAGRALAAMYPHATDDEGTVLDTAALAALEQYRNVDSTITELTDERDRLRQRLMAALGDAPVGYDGERAAVRWTNVTTRRWDTKSLEQDFPNLAEVYKTPTTYRRFSVPVPTEDKHGHH